MIKKTLFWIIFCISTIALMSSLYFFFFYGSGNDYLNNIIQSTGLKDTDTPGMESEPAIPIPESNNGGSEVSGSSGTSGSIGSTTSSSSEGSSFEGSTNTMVFCTFEADKIVEGIVPCRCGLSAVCTEVGMICDATFNEGQGICEFSGN